MKLTQITLMDDIGEVWLKDGEIIGFVYWSDGYFKNDYYGDIFKTCGIDIEEINLFIEDKKDKEKTWKAWGDDKKMKKLLPVLLKKYQVN